MIEAIRLQNVRSYASGVFEFAKGVNIVVGPNASGKTNLLEAVHVAVRGSGFKSADRDLVRHGQEWARIDASVCGENRVIKIRHESPQKITKSFEFDETPRRSMRADSMIPVVLFEPNHLLLLAGEPERRRAYADTILEVTERRHAAAVKDYRRILRQRNRLLKQGSVSAEHMFVWDLQLSDLGGLIATSRRQLLEGMAERLREAYSAVSGGTDVLRVEYQSKLPSGGYTQALLDRLRTGLDTDRVRGFTGAGPHRDDIQFMINDRPARSDASRGEVRSIVLALKLCEYDIVSEATGSKPIVLLDDVFSELDGRRRRLLTESLQSAQTFITTTDADIALDYFERDCAIISTSS